MGKITRRAIEVKQITEGRDNLSELIRCRIRQVIEVILEEELDEALGAERYSRDEDRRGYRNGKKERTLSTGYGASELEVPRARIFTGDGSEEWKSQLLPRYQRRVRAVDAGILGAYLSGVNSRRIRGALAPLLRGAPLSRSTVSRIVARLKVIFETWRKRDLSQEPIIYLYMDALFLKVKVNHKGASIPVLVALGVRGNGEKTILTLEAAGGESRLSWKAVLDDLVGRNLVPPVLVIIDVHLGLRQAVEETWPGVQVQRCSTHKLRNLESKVPLTSRDEVREDFHKIIYAQSFGEGKQAYEAFLKKWQLLAPAAAASLEEAGEELLTFYRFPAQQWKSLRSTNAIERLNEEFRRRVKTQASLPNDRSALLVLFGLLATGQIRFRRIEGFETLQQGVVNLKDKNFQQQEIA